MRGITLVLVAYLATQAFAGQPDDSDRTWDELAAELRSLKTVAGWWAGGGTASWRFFTLSKLMIEVGREEDFRDLLKDESPVVRCMGLLTLAQTKGKDSVPVLRAQLADRGRITYMPGGCPRYSLTVGRFARELLRDANHLERRGTPPMPLVSKRGLLGADLEILAREPTIRRFDRSVAALTIAMEANRRVPPLRFFQRLCPSLAGFEIVRTLGRLRCSPPQQDFLITCLRDEALDAQTRLAAASALTRHASDAVSQAIQSHRDALNRLDEGCPGDQLLETLKLRAQYEKNMRPLRNHDNWRQMNQDTRGKVVTAFTCPHPLAVDDLLRRLRATVVEDDPDVRQTFVGSLIAISKNASKDYQAWNTYSDTPYRLASLLWQQRSIEARRTLTEDECQQIEQHIKHLLPEN